jgi:hypothetical protein
MNADFSTTRRKKFSAFISVQKGKCQVDRLNTSARMPGANSSIRGFYSWMVWGAMSLDSDFAL